MIYVVLMPKTYQLFQYYTGLKGNKTVGTFIFLKFKLLIMILCSNRFSNFGNLCILRKPIHSKTIKRKEPDFEPKIKFKNKKKR